MREAAINGTWQMPYVHSPTGSVDSGVGLSPTRAAPAYGPYDECYGQICSDVYGPESPAFSSGSPQMADGNLACPASLTQEELDTLSDTLSDVLSPCSEEHHSSVADLTEIGQLGFQQQRPAENITELFDSGSSERSISTLKRKRSQKARHIGLCESNPGVDPCLVPKSGTAKPRQSRRRKEPTKSMAGGQGAVRMNQKRYYSGARVKETARQRLQRIRQERQLNEEALESSNRVTAAGNVQNLNQQAPSKRTRIGVDEIGALRSTPYPVSQPQGAVHQTARPQITHSVQQILSQSHAFHRDELDSVLEEAVERDNTRPLEAYAQQAHVSFSSSRQTTFQHILKRLGDSKDRYPVQKIKNVATLLCRIFPDLINQQNLQGETPLYQAALYGNEGVVQALMERGAEPRIQENSAGETAWHAAVKSKKYSVVEAILQGSQHSRPPFAAGINIPSCDGNTPLHKASALRDMDLEVQRKIVTALLNFEADPSIKNNQSAMAHSFLPESLKELQNRMKGTRGRRSRVVQQHSSPMYGEPHLQCHVPEYPPQYVQHFSSEMMLPRNVAQCQQYTYTALPQPVQGFPTTSQTPVTHYDQFYPQTTQGYYPGQPRAAVANLISPNQATNAECPSGVEFEDFLNSFSA